MREIIRYKALCRVKNKKRYEGCEPGLLSRIYERENLDGYGREFPGRRWWRHLRGPKHRAIMNLPSQSATVLL